jgi:hypothetical protein
MEESERLATIPSSLLLGNDVDALHYAAVEQGCYVRHVAGERVQLVAYRLPVSEGRDFDYAETTALERGETDGRQSDDAGADLQAAHRWQIVADGEVCDQKGGTLLYTKEEPSCSYI